MRKGMYNSVWNDGEKVISTYCEFDFDNDLIENVGQVSGQEIEDCHSLDREYVEDEDGNELEVCTECHEHFLRVRMVENKFNSTILEKENFCRFCEEEHN